MIGDNLDDFLDMLFWGEELEVEFRGKRYFIQGYYKELHSRKPVAHMEVFATDSGDFLWEMDSPSMSVCASAFLNAEIWSGMSFVRAEPEIEWLI